MPRLAAAVPVLCLLASSALAQSGADCFSRDEVLRLRENLPQSLRDNANADYLLKAQAYVESERLSRSGVRILQKNKRMNVGLPQDIPDYVKVVTVPATDECAALNMPQPMSPIEVDRIRRGESESQMMGDMLEVYSDSLIMLGAMMDNEAGLGSYSQEDVAQLAGGDVVCKQMEVLSNAGRDQAGNRPEYSDTFAIGLSPVSRKPSALIFLMGPACFAQAGAGIFQNYEPEDNDAIAQQRQVDLSSAAEEIEDRGTTTIDGVSQRQLAVTGLNMAQTGEDGRTVTVNEIAVWFDLENLVRTKMRMEGVMEEGGKEQDFYLETVASDFRTVPGTELYEPYREVLRMGGMLTEAEQAQMAEAQEKLAELDQQLASMPASQRAMMERMMGPQIEQMRNMVRGDGIEFEFITTEIIVNPDFTQQAATSFAPATSETELLQIIQRHLVTLGYDPGNTAGELTRPTVVAISRFQAEKGMEVTGQPSPQLAGVLAAEVDTRN